jgi:Arc/MetJ-type ribon-helix-helix transcriptional regulator
MATDQVTTVQTRIPARLLEEMQALVQGGWFHDLDELMLEALRRYLDARRPELMERFIRQDAEWGLRGRD